MAVAIPGEASSNERLSPTIGGPVEMNLKPMLSENHPYALLSLLLI
jgi:hypothetical protein